MIKKQAVEKLKEAIEDFERNFDKNSRGCKLESFKIEISATKNKLMCHWKVK